MTGTGVKLTLLAFSLLGFWTLWGFPAKNNLLHFLGELSDPGASIPGPVYAPMKQRYTGIKPVDKQLTTLVGFFYTAVDGNRFDIALSFLNLGSQVLAAWVLITAESYRVGNKNSFIITSITLFGLSVVIIGYACVAPLWFILHLSLSKAVSNPKDFNLIINQPIRLALTPFATMIGFGIPSAMMALPAPSILSFQAKQNWIAIQQGWPLWILLAQKTLEAVVSSSDPMVVMRTEKQKRDETVKYMRRAYLFALSSSAFAHLAYSGLALVAYLSPELLSTKLQVQLNVDNYIIPPNPFSDAKATTLPNAALWFLQWDLIIGTLSTMIWGLAVLLQSKGKIGDLGAWLSALVRYGATALIVGPSGAAVLAIWTRDEAALKPKNE